MLIRSDSAGATYGFAAFCRQRRGRVLLRVRGAGPGPGRAGPVGRRGVAGRLDGIDVWYPTINADGTMRDGAWVAEATALLDLSAWPTGSRVILRKERPHPGCAADVPRRRRAPGHRVHHRHPAGVVPGQLAGLDLRHRQHARVEDRIRQAKATGMRNFPCHSYAANQAWLEIVMTATRPRRLDQAARLRRRNPTWPAARSRRSATGCCTSPPGSPAAPARPGSASTGPGGGPHQIATAWHQIRAAFT